MSRKRMRMVLLCLAISVMGGGLIAGCGKSDDQPSNSQNQATKPRNPRE